MKIVHLTTVDMSLRYLVLPQLEAARDLGEAIGISAPGEYVDEIEQRGVRHIALGASTRKMSLKSDWRAARQLHKILKEEQIDILHTHNPKPGLYGRVVGRLTGVPVVVNTVHGLYATEDSSVFKRALVYGAEFVASRFSDMELVQSPEDLNLMRRLHITPRRRTRLLGNGIDLERFDPVAARTDRDAVRSELGVEPNQVLVGMVGRLVYEKGVRELIEAALGLDDRFVVVVVGPHDPDKDDSIPKEDLNRGADGGVRFLGMRRDVERLYGAFDVFVLPSHREGFPRAAMEAAASGLPVIASDIRGCRQVVDEGVNGFLFPVRDAEALGDRIKTLGDDPDLRRSMGEASAVKAVAEFDERQVVERVVEAYRDVARDKGLSWKWNRDFGGATIEHANLEDAESIARLHQATITEGFLSRLGARFLTTLYRAMCRDPGSTVLVARDGDTVAGFVAGTDDTSRFYRRFLRGSLFPALWALLPVLLKPSTWRRIIETLRYGQGRGRAGAELLSMAVAPGAQRIGLGRQLVRELLEQSLSSGVTTMKVVVGADNQAAKALYEDCGFTDATDIEVHGGLSSWELVWSG